MKADEKKLTEISVDEFGPEGNRPLKLFFNSKEVKEAQNGGEVLECLKHENGNMPYSPMRCKALAETPDGKKLIKEIRRICEGGKDKGTGKKEIRKPKIDQDR